MNIITIDKKNLTGNNYLSKFLKHMPSFHDWLLDKYIITKHGKSVLEKAIDKMGITDKWIILGSSDGLRKILFNYQLINEVKYESRFLGIHENANDQFKDQGYTCSKSDLMNVIMQRENISEMNKKMNKNWTLSEESIKLEMDIQEYLFVLSMIAEYTELIESAGNTSFMKLVDTVIPYGSYSPINSLLIKNLNNKTNLLKGTNLCMRQILARDLLHNPIDHAPFVWRLYMLGGIDELIMVNNKIVAYPNKGENTYLSYTNDYHLMRIDSKALSKAEKKDEYDKISRESYMASYYIQIDGSHEVLLSNNATIRTLNEVTTEMSVMFKDDSQPITLDVIEKVYRVKEKSLIKELEPITKFFAIKEEAIALQGKIPGILEFDGETITYVSNECVAVIPMKVLDSDGNIVEEIPYPPLKFTWEINETVVCCESLNPKIKELPHVFEDKKICLGDYATEVIDAMDNNDLEMVINLLVLSRKGVNPGDYLGKNIYKMIDNLGYTIERDYCSDCGNDIDECSCNDVSCASCGEYVNDDDIYWDDHNNGYCQSCYSDIYFYCNECSNDKNRENGVSIYGIGSANESYEDTIICEHCVDNGEYMCCSECNHYYNYEDIEQYYDKYQESSSLCTMCKDNYHTFECEECGERHAYSKDSNVTICNQCKEDQDDTGENSVSDGTSKEELPDRDSDEGISQYVPDS